MSTTDMQRRPRKFRRTGRHTTPSQVEKVAEKAGKAAPAVAIAGAMVAGPAAGVASAAPAKATTVAVHVHKTTAHKTATRHTTKIKHIGYAGPASHSYTVQQGDTLASIAQKFYGDYNKWTTIYQANTSVLSDPDHIYPGERLQIPAGATMQASGGTAVRHTTHRAKHAKPAAATTQSTSAIPHGQLSCNGLEQLWVDAGGAPSKAHIAAEIAMAESGGNQFASSPTNDHGYWQINGSWGPLSTFDALGNAKAAVHISSDGQNWSPWTTYTSGAYYGRC